MMGGVPVERQWVLVLKNGTVAIDWGDGLFQDVYSGKFFEGTEAQVSHTITDGELDMLQYAGYATFDGRNVFFQGLPERQLKELD